MYTMEPFQRTIAFDIDSFTVCQNCLRFIVILLVECYVAFLSARVVINVQKSNYDKLDISIFVVSTACILVDLGSAIFLGIGISYLGMLLKVIWSLVLYLIFLRFIFRREKCAKYFIISLLALTTYFLISLLFQSTIPIRYSLLIVYTAITVCAFHQCFFISELLNHEKARQKELKLSLYHRVLKQNQIQLLDQRKEYEHRVISAQVKYHLYLRRHFCIVITLTLLVSYYLLWNLEESRNSIGECLVVIVIEVLPTLEYYFYACANQWLTQRVTREEERRSADVME